VKIKQAKGFSLTEMIIVIAILAIAAAIAAPQYMAWRDNQNLREAVRDLASDIEFWRQRAIAENIYYQIQFNQGTNSYRIFQGGQLGTDPYSPLVPDVTKSPGNISSQVIISNVAFVPPQITIQPRGTMSGGSVTLQHSTRGSTGQITLAQFSGRAPSIAYAP
jgi:type IV fimbrial biogenesis protein FimT